MKKTCLITGGNGFLGTKYCNFFLKKNFKVYCIDINYKKKKKKKNFIPIKCDITKEREVENLFNLISKKNFINVLINNAAIDAVPNKKKIDNRYVSEKNWNQELNVGLKGSYLMIKYFGDKMYKKKRGSIINIGSDLSIIAPNQNIYKSYNNYIKPVTYSVIKHGLLGMTKYFASLYAENNVRVNMISPGSIKRNQNKKLTKQLKNIIPMNRLGNPDDVMGILLYLASDYSNYTTGQNFLIDGGRTII